MTELDTDAARVRVGDPDGPRLNIGEDATAVEPGEDKSRAGTIFNLLMFIIGGVALVWMLRTTSWDELRAVMVGIGNWAVVILVLDVGAMCLDAAAWHAFMRPEARMVSYWRVLGAWASGRAINVLTPTGALGEPTKLTMLLNHAPRARLLSSLVLLNVAVLYLAVTVMVIGIPITLLLVDLPDALKVMIGLGVAVIIPAMIALGFVIQRGATSTMIGLLKRVRLISAERATTWKSKLREVDKHIREIQSDRTAGTRTGLLYVLASKLVAVVATIVVIHAIDIEVTAALVIALMSVGVLIRWVAAVVPLGLGIADGGNYALFSLLGATGLHGMIMAMLNRARSVAVAMLGLLAMAAMTALDRRARNRIQAKILELRLRASRRRRRTKLPRGRARRRAS